MKEAILTVGCSASGKSTWATEFLKTKPGWMHVERDRIRRVCAKQFTANEFNVPGNDPRTREEDHTQWFNAQSLWGVYSFKHMENSVQEVYDGLIDEAITLGCNLMVSDTNLNPVFRNALVEKLEKNGYSVELKFFNEEYKKLIERDSKRRDSVGQQVIAKQYFDFMDQFGSNYGFHKVVKTDGAKDCILVDIDGTLAHMNRGRSPYEWDKVGQDKVDEVVRFIVNGYYNAGTHVIVMSGRDAICRPQTMEWLENNDIGYHSLYMRPEGDMRSDVVVKNEIVQNQINGNYNPIAWFDDRPCVVRLANILGVKSIAMGNQHLEF